MNSIICFLFLIFASVYSNTVKRADNCPLAFVLGNPLDPIDQAGEQPIAVDFGAGDCDWYSESSCCSAADAKTINTFTQLIVDRDAYKKCFDIVRLSLCGVCSPNVGDFYDYLTYLRFFGLKPCRSFCGKLYNACSNYTDGTTLTTGTEAEYCAGTNDDQPCFNSATALPISILLLLAALLLNF